MVAILGLATSAGLPVVAPSHGVSRRSGSRPCRSRTSRRSAAGGPAIARVSMADISVLSRTFAARAGTRVDPDQELLALGVSNVAAGLFDGSSISTSTSRTPSPLGRREDRSSRSGRRTHHAVLPRSPRDHGSPAPCGPGRHRHHRLPVARRHRWPGPALAAPSSRFAPIDRLLRRCRLARRGAGHLHRRRAGPGCVIWRAWRPYSAILGRVDELKGYHDVTRYPEAGEWTA